MGIAQQAWLETTLLLPWMYHPGAVGEATDRFYEMSVKADQYRCAFDDDNDVKGKATDRLSGGSAPGFHLCIAVCQEGTSECYPSALVAITADVLKAVGANFVSKSSAADASPSAAASSAAKATTAALQSRPAI